ncbi:capsular polysaccharide export protein [Sphingobium yanoikuyae]|uniref:capsular polysaccharide export protein n=1 Tax=Sphingobium yanoikuyae TaxID=13690 RepID=UPI000262B87B|nr:capsular polysaccharide export protein [Sphingobium yanoikuyae]
MVQNKEHFEETWHQNLMVKVRQIKPTFAIFVIIPTILAAIYFGFIASDVYVSQSHFVVRTEKKEQAFGIDSLITGASRSGASDEIYAVEEYMNSRDALQNLNRDKLVTNAYSRPDISFFNRFGSSFTGASNEELYKYMQSRVTATYDGSKSVTTLRVRAYTPQDAQQINERLLQQGEALVNKLNNRGRNDLIRYAQGEVEEAKERAAQAAEALSDFRNRRGVVDPEKQASVQVQLVSKLQDEMIAAQTQLDELRQFAADNPQVPVLQQRVASIRRQIGQEMGKIAGGQQSLAGKTPGYERLSLQNEFAIKQLSVALASLESAKNEARRQQIYIERIAQPSLPDKAAEPKRLKGILSTFILGLVLYGVFTLLFAGIKEHQS